MNEENKNAGDSGQERERTRNMMLATVDEYMAKMQRREVVQQMNVEITAALQKVAESHGFTFLPGNLRFDDVSVSGRMSFALKGKETEVAARAAGTRGCGFAVGDMVTIKGQSNDERFKVAGFRRVNVILERIGDGKSFLAKASMLEKIG